MSTKATAGDNGPAVCKHLGQDRVDAVMTQSGHETVRISPVRQADLTGIADIAREIWYLHYPGIITVGQIDYMLGQRYQPDLIGKQIASRAAWWDKLEVSGSLAGFAGYEPGSAPGSVKLDKLYVHPRWQGRGLGYALVQNTVAHSIGRGYSTLYLQVNKGNAASVRFYHRAGFRVTDSVRIDIGDGFVMDDFVMSKQLGDK